MTTKRASVYEDREGRLFGNDAEKPVTSAVDDYIKRRQRNGSYSKQVASSPTSLRSPSNMDLIMYI